MNPYETLGVSKTATQNEIKAAYRKLAKKFHPDFNPGNKTAETKFKEINTAYELIGTEEARKKFDEGPKHGPEFWQNFGGAQSGQQRGPYYYQTQQRPGARYSTGFGQSIDPEMFSAIFGDAFSGGARGFGAGGTFEDVGFQEPQAETYSMEIDFRDSILGAEREITLPTGRKLRVTIPPGVQSGNKLRFAAKEKGQTDVYVELQVRPSPTFKRTGHDIESEAEITIDQAVLGGEIQIPTVDGSVMMKIPKGSNTGARLRLKGKGVKGKGDQYVTLKIVLPKTVDPSLESAIRQWAESQAPRGTP